MLDSVAQGASMIARQVASLCGGMIGQGTRIGRAWSEVWERLRADFMQEKKEDEGNLEEGKGKEEKMK